MLSPHWLWCKWAFPWEDQRTFFSQRTKQSTAQHAVPVLRWEPSCCRSFPSNVHTLRKWKRLETSNSPQGSPFKPWVVPRLKDCALDKMSTKKHGFHKTMSQWGRKTESETEKWGGTTNEVRKRAREKRELEGSGVGQKKSYSVRRPECSLAPWLRQKNGPKIITWHVKNQPKNPKIKSYTLNLN